MPQIIFAEKNMGLVESNKKYYDANRDELLRKLKAKRARLTKRQKRRIKEQMRAANRKRLYGLTEEQFEKKLSKQNGKCAICRNELTNPGVDHDRSCCPREGSCGRCVRGLLCLNCNTFLGFAKDSIKNLRSAIKYLRKYKCQSITESSPKTDSKM
jgi:hypothetical protein